MLYILFLEQLNKLSQFVASEVRPIRIQEVTSYTGDVRMLSFLHESDDTGRAGGMPLSTLVVTVVQDFSHSIYFQVGVKYAT